MGCCSNVPQWRRKYAAGIGTVKLRHDTTTRKRTKPSGKHCPHPPACYGPEFMSGAISQLQIIIDSHDGIEANARCCIYIFLYISTRARLRCAVRQWPRVLKISKRNCYSWKAVRRHSDIETQSMNRGELYTASFYKYWQKLPLGKWQMSSSGEIHLLLSPR